jgi:hypothetical protein
MRDGTNKLPSAKAEPRTEGKHPLVIRPRPIIGLALMTSSVNGTPTAGPPSSSYQKFIIGLNRLDISPTNSLTGSKSTNSPSRASGLFVLTLNLPKTFLLAPNPYSACGLMAGSIQTTMRQCEIGMASICVHFCSGVENQNSSALPSDCATALAMNLSTAALTVAVNSLRCECNDDRQLVADGRRSLNANS